MLTDISNMLGPKKPCQTPGCNYPNWHVCTLGKPDLFPALLAEEEGKTPRQIRRMRTPEHIENIREAQLERWGREKERHKKRDAAIVKMYTEQNVSIKQVAMKFRIGLNVARRVLKEAEARGEVKIRPQGKTIKYGFND